MRNPNPTGRSGKTCSPYARTNCETLFGLCCSTCSRRPASLPRAPPFLVCGLRWGLLGLSPDTFFSLRFGNHKLDRSVIHVDFTPVRVLDRNVHLITNRKSHERSYDRCALIVDPFVRCVKMVGPFDVLGHGLHRHLFCVVSCFLGVSWVIH